MPRSLASIRFCVQPLVLLLLIAEPARVLAQDAQRQVFPGRRVGGGTRSLCAARLVAHLVPPANVFAPGQERTIAIVQWSTPVASALLLAYTPRGAGSSSGSGSHVDLPASTEASVTLLRAPALPMPVVWESSNRCDEGELVDDSSTSLDFVAAKAPPAVSLLVADAVAEDRAFQSALVSLRGLCGVAVSRDQLASGFGLDRQLMLGLPERVPVRCLP